MSAESALAAVQPLSERPLRTAVERCGSQLPVGQLERKFPRVLAHGSQKVGAHLMSEASRSGMNQDGDVPLFETERRRGLSRVHLFDIANFEKVVSGPQ